MLGGLLQGPGDPGKAGEFGVRFAFPRMQAEEGGHGRPDRVGVKGVEKAFALIRFDLCFDVGALSPGLQGGERDIGVVANGAAQGGWHFGFVAEGLGGDLAQTRGEGEVVAAEEAHAVGDIGIRADGAVLGLAR